MPENILEQQYFTMFPIFERALSFDSMSMREKNIAIAMVRNTKAFLNWIRKKNAKKITTQSLLVEYAQSQMASETIVKECTSLNIAEIYLRFISQQEAILPCHSNFETHNPLFVFRFLEVQEWQSLWNSAWKAYEMQGEASCLTAALCIILMSFLGLSVDEIANLRISEIQIDNDTNNISTIKCLGKTLVLPSNSIIVEVIEKYLGYSLSIWNQKYQNENINTFAENAFVLTTPRGKYSSSWLWRLVTIAATEAGINKIHPLLFRLTFFRANFISHKYLQSLITSIEKPIGQQIMEKL